MDADCDKLQRVGCDIVFAPSEREFYPTTQTFRVIPDPALGNILEGHFRPGFFEGVCTVVAKLLACTQARVAVFGKKDYQQLMVVRNMVAQLAMPVEIVGRETSRTDDGLAMSSRNSYLSAEQRKRALLLPNTLNEMVRTLRSGSSEFAAIESQAMKTLSDAGWTPDYMTVRRRADLQAPIPGDPLIVLGAATLGSTRLIDNFEVG